MLTLTKDKTKKEQVSTVFLINMIKRGEINLNHPLQRRSGQWKPGKRDELVASIIRGEDIPNLIICQKGIVDYLIDGLQRVSTISMYRQDCFRLGKRIEDPEIVYRQMVRDENGEVVMDSDGNPELELVSFDIRGKKYSELPEELQDMVDNYPFCVTKIYNCTDEEIGRHIRRYNNGKAMTNAQSSITFLSSGLADKVKKTASSHIFFQDITDFSGTVRKNGMLEKIIIESLMASFHLSNWSRDPGQFLSECNWKSELEILSDNMTRLAECLDENTAKLFTTKDTFLYIGLFSRFASEHEATEDHKFNSFLAALQSGGIQNDKWDELNKSRGTKDKKCVEGKMQCLDEMMHEYTDEAIEIGLEDGQSVITCDLFEDILKPNAPLNIVKECFDGEKIDGDKISEFIECTDILNELSLNCKFDLFQYKMRDLVFVAKTILNGEINIEDNVMHIAKELNELTPEERGKKIAFGDFKKNGSAESGLTSIASWGNLLQTASTQLLPAT